MRVLQCTHYFHPSIGGTQLATYNLSKNLMTLGVDVKIITFNIDTGSPLRNGYFTSNLPNYEKIDGLPVHRCPVVILGKGSGAKTRFKIKVSPSAVKLVLREKPDIIHFQGANEVLQFIASSYVSMFSQSKTVLTTHGIFEQVALFREQKFSKWLNERLLKMILSRVDRIIALSKADLTILDYLGISCDKVTVLPNGVDIAKFRQPEINPPSQNQELDTPYVLCVTRIRENKGIEFLIKAAAEVVSKRSDVKFVVVGNCTPAYSTKLQGLIYEHKLEKNFMLKGYLPENKVLELYKHASLFVLPSLRETLPLVLLEAMAAGLPIVASRVGGIPDLVTSSEGLLTPPGDVSKLSSSLLLLLENNEIRTKLGESARKKAENYSWDTVAKRILSVYEKLLTE